MPYSATKPSQATASFSVLLIDLPMAENSECRVW